jgi:flagellar hook-associated protein 2
VASVDGLVSGMDTSTIINQLLQLERQPQLRLEQKKAAHEAKIAAYQMVNAKLIALQSAADTLGKADTWRAFKVTSSTSSVSATASTSAIAGSYAFEVRALAKAHSAFYGDPVTSTAERITTDTSITITKDGTTSDPIDVGDGSMASVINAINAAGAGVKAAAVQVEPDRYRLQLTSTTTGTASAFAVNGDLGTATTLVQGADATIRIGDASTVDITSATNTFTDVFPGVTFTVSKLETATIDVTSDAAGIATKVQAMVTAANGVLDEIAKLTAYNPDTKKAAILTGDGTMRALQQRLLNLVSGSGGQSLSDVGISLTRKGRIEFSATAFDAAFQGDPVATAARFRPGGTFDGTAPVTFLHAGDRTQPGTYGVHVAREAERATVTLAPPGPLADGDTLTLRTPGKDPVAVVLASTDTSATIATKLNDAIAANGLGLVASAEPDGSIVVRSTAYGTSASFAIDETVAGITTSASLGSLSGTIEGTETIDISTSSGTFSVAAASGDTLHTLASRINDDAVANGVSLTARVVSGRIVLEPPSGETIAVAVTGGANGTLGAYVPGVDVAGWFDDNGRTVAATGTGQALVSSASDPTLTGLALEIGAGSGTGLLGSFTYAPGLAQRLDSFAGDAIRSGTGRLTTVIEGGQRQIKNLGDQIAGWDTRLALKETTLRRQFTSLEVMLGKLRDQSNWLSGQLAGLMANNG